MVLAHIRCNGLQAKYLWRNGKGVFCGSVLCLRLHRVALQYAKIAPFREDFTIPIPNREMTRIGLMQNAK
jgi:hypothetical protein